MRITFKAHFWLGLLTLCGLNTVVGQALPPAPEMTFLDNGEVRIGMDLALGGAVTFISSKDHPGNIINSADLGRQIQMGALTMTVVTGQMSTKFHDTVDDKDLSFGEGGDCPVLAYNLAVTKNLRAFIHHDAP